MRGATHALRVSLIWAVRALLTCVVMRHASQASHMLLRRVRTADSSSTTCFARRVPQGQPPPCGGPASYMKPTPPQTAHDLLVQLPSSVEPLPLPFTTSLTPPPTPSPTRHHGGAVRQPARARRRIQEHAGAGAGGAAAGLRAGAGGQGMKQGGVGRPAGALMQVRCMWMEACNLRAQTPCGLATVLPRSLCTPHALNMSHVPTPSTRGNLHPTPPRRRCTPSTCTPSPSRWRTGC